MRGAMWIRERLRQYSTSSNAENFPKYIKDDPAFEIKHCQMLPTSGSAFASLAPLIESHKLKGYSLNEFVMPFFEDELSHPSGS